MIDVVIPVGPVRRFLPEALASVRSQGDLIAHIWLVDDASPTQPHSDRLAACAADDVTVIPNTRRPGIGGARNTGAHAGTAPLLAFLDADDVWPRERSALLLDALSDDRAIPQGMTAQFRAAPDSHEEPVFAALIGSVLLPRVLWHEVGDFDEELRLGEAIDWMSRARALGAEPCRVAQVVHYRRLHQQNTTIARRGERDAYLEVVRRHLQRRG